MKKLLLIILTLTTLLICSCADMNSIENSKSGDRLTTEAELTSDTAMTNENEVESSETEASDIEISEDPFEEYWCQDHVDSYHNIQGDLVEYLGLNEFNEWAEYHWANDIEGLNIHKLILDFNIPKEDFKNVYENTNMFYTSYYDVDALYSGDEELVQKYALDKDGHKYRMNEKIGEFYLKLDIKYYMWQEGMDISAYENLVYSSIPDMIYHSGMSKDHIQKMIGRTNNQTEINYQIDLDKIYSEGKTLWEGKDAKEVDRAIRLSDLG